jgi:hypothetical protein
MVIAYIIINDPSVFHTSNLFTMNDKTAVYHIACHCQTHVLQLTLPTEDLFSDNGVCDCSHCLKRRIVWGPAPKGSLKVLKGVGTNGVNLQSYIFGEKAYAHQVSLLEKGV